MKKNIEKKLTIPGIIRGISVSVGASLTLYSVGKYVFDIIQAGDYPISEQSLVSFYGLALAGIGLIAIPAIVKAMKE